MRTTSLHINEQLTWRGGERQTLYLLESLNERGHLAELLCQPGSVIAERARSAGIIVHPTRMRGEADLMAAYRIARLIARGRYNVVHMHTSHAHMLGCLACAFNRKPLCIVSRRVDFPINRKPFGLPALKYRWRVDHYIAISEAVKRVLVSGGVAPDRISIVHSGVRPKPDPETRGEIRGSLGIPDNAPLVGNVGALVDHKGQRYLIEAAPLVLRENPRVRFVIIGDGELRQPLESLASRLGVKDAIIFTGFQPDVARYVCGFDLFVAPSHMEGLNTSIIDAMMLQRPVVGTTAGGIPELICHGETGLLVPARDPRALAAAILELLKDPERARRLARGGYERVTREFTADRMCEGTIAVYEKLLSTSRHRRN
jgi:glycosyltransferase involved in cell wall biosynthesis